MHIIIIVTLLKVKIRPRELSTEIPNSEQLFA